MSNQGEGPQSTADLTAFVSAPPVPSRFFKVVPLFVERTPEIARLSRPRDPTQVQNLLTQMQSRFQQMSDSIITRIDEMGERIDDLERSVQDLVSQAEEGDGEDKGAVSKQ